MEKGEHLKRQNRPTMLQLQYLQGLSKVEKKRGAQGSIAEYYGVNRSTVNRYFKNCIERRNSDKNHGIYSMQEKNGWNDIPTCMRILKNIWKKSVQNRKKSRNHWML